jgi:hypothetical protein
MVAELDDRVGLAPDRQHLTVDATNLPGHDAADTA